MSRRGQWWYVVSPEHPNPYYPPDTYTLEGPYATREEARAVCRARLGYYDPSRIARITDRGVESEARQRYLRERGDFLASLGVQS